MKVLISILAIGVLAIGSGCATGGGNALSAYEAFQNQDDEIDLMNISFVDGGGELNLVGVTGFRMQAQKKIKAAMPANPNTAASVISGVKDIALGAAGIYTLGQVATKDPTVIQQPQPVIVQPSYPPVPAQ